MVKKKAPIKKKTTKRTAKKKQDPSWDEIGSAIGKKIETATESSDMRCRVKEKVRHGSGGGFYFLGFVGSLVYYVTTAPTLWEAFIGFFKAVFWPAFLTYGIMKSMGL